MSTISINKKSSGLAAILSRNQKKLISEWIKEMSSSIRRNDLIRDSDLRIQCSRFFELMTQTMESGDDINFQSSAWSEIREMLADISRSRAQQGFTPSETAMFVFSAKRPVLNLIRQTCKDAQELAAETWAVTELLDTMGLYTTEVYQKSREEVIEQQQALAELNRRELAQLNETLEKRVMERTMELKTANDSLRDLSARLLQIQDEERKRIARELHDSVGQLLAAIKMNNAAMASEMAGNQRIVQALAESDSMVEEVLRSIRTISHLLHPPLLDVAGLPSALRSYVDEFVQRSGINVVLDCAPSVGRLPSELETALFRIVQECLGNVHRHSSSSTATIHLSVDNGKAYLEVSDEGRGIPIERQRELTAGGGGGVGLRGMQERVAQLGGKLQLQSSSKGTIVTAVLPSTSVALFGKNSSKHQPKIV
jgi:signal transduction histidine kinase